MMAWGAWVDLRAFGVQMAGMVWSLVRGGLVLLLLLFWKEGREDEAKSAVLVTAPSTDDIRKNDASWSHTLDYEVVSAYLLCEYAGKSHQKTISCLRISWRLGKVVLPVSRCNISSRYSTAGLSRRKECLKLFQCSDQMCSFHLEIEPLAGCILQSTWPLICFL